MATRLEPWGPPGCGSTVVASPFETGSEQCARHAPADAAVAAHCWRAKAAAALAHRLLL